MTPMSAADRARFDQADALNDAAGVAMVAGRFDRAVALLLRAAALSPTAKQALLDRALEAAEMGVSVEALADEARRMKSA